MKTCGESVNVLRSENGGEYTISDFTSYLTKEGIRHEQTIAHTPQQNGIAERLKHRNPTKALSGIPPYEAWSGTKPDVSALRIFGCSAYAHVAKTK